MVRCPGQDQRFWKPQDIFEVDCAKCGKPVEFFKDEPQLKCRQCGHAVINPKIDLGCAEWCQYAEQCLGVRFSSLMIIRQKLIDEMRKVLGMDEKRIEHALAVLDYAERIHAVEGGDPLVVKAVAILHDIGFHQSERKLNSSMEKNQEIKSSSGASRPWRDIAEDILKRHDISNETVKKVCKIIEHRHSAKDIDMTEFRILWDADRLVNILHDCPGSNKEKLVEIVDKTFKTHEGRRIAAELFLKDEL